MADSAVAGVKRKAPHTGHGGDDGDADPIVSGDGAAADGPAGKRPRVAGTAIMAYGGGGSGSDALIALPQAPASLFEDAADARVSDLEAPTMELGGHGAAVLGLAFDPTGRMVASASRDKTVMLWHAFGGCDNYSVLSGHKNAVTAVAWGGAGGPDRLYTASADKSGGLWDAETGVRVRSFIGHSRIVNCVAASRRGSEMAVTVGDDSLIKLWDCRSRHAAQTFSDKYPLLAVEFGDDGTSIMTGGTDGVVRQWELRRCIAINSFAGHRDAVTGVSLSPDGNTLLSFGMDNAVRAWDVRPFTTAADRCVKVFTGASNNFEQSAIRCAWSGNGESIACGSADRNVYVWDYGSGRVTHVLPGHAGVVHAVAFSSTAPVIASGGHDKRVFLGELIAAAGTAGAGAAVAAGGAGTSDSV